MLASKTRISVATLLMTAMVLMVNTGSTGAADGHSVGVVTAKEIRVQSEPGKHGLLQKTLRRGSRLTIIKRRQGWIQILHAGEVGFIRDQAQLIKILPKKNPKQPVRLQQILRVSKAGWTNMRNGKSISARK